MEILYWVLALLGLACFILAAFSVSLHPKFSLLAAGLAFWIAIEFIARTDALTH
jgi:hypothetical protein